jgi:predicted nucleic acid-binding Zn ribbon protein
MSKQTTLKVLEKLRDFTGNIIASGDYSENDKTMLSDIEKSIKWVNSCNGATLHEKRKCHNCGRSFIPKNYHQKCCSDNCRIQLHRAKKRAKVFNNKIQEIISQIHPKPKFIIEQILTDSSKCPFVVYINGNRFESESTKSLISQIKKAL